MTTKDSNTLRLELSRIQKLIGRRMAQSKQTKPCFYLNAKADITEVTRIRRPLCKKLGARIATNDFYIRAMALAIEKFPLIAGVFKTDHIQIAEEINVGLAVASPVGLVVPVVKRANTKSLAEIGKDTAELIAKAKNNKLALDDLEGACITLTALGMFGIESFLAVPSIGQGSIISVGKIIEVPVPIDGDIITRKHIELAIAADHTVVNGDYAAKFLNAVVTMLESPESLL